MYTASTSVSITGADEDSAAVQAAFKEAVAISLDGVEVEQITCTSSKEGVINFEISFQCRSSTAKCNRALAATTNPSDAKLLKHFQETMRARNLEPPTAVRTVEAWRVKLKLEVLKCPPFGVDCSGDTYCYKGDVWHDPSVGIPNCTASNGTKICTPVYTCVNAGCPERGSSEMKCRQGYKPNSPLCAVCDKGYYMQMRNCHACGNSFRVSAFLMMLVMVLIALGLLCRLVARYWWILGRSSMMSHVKILVSFVIVIISVDVQFGVAWPPAFAQLLDMLSIFSFDLGVLGGILCRVDYGFYDLHFGSTMFLVGAVAAVWVTWWLLKRLRNYDARHEAVYVAVHLCLFAYPVISVRVVDTFACHEIEGVFYLRADYSIECYDERWYGNAVYAGIWIALFVVLFPLAITYKLWSYYTPKSALSDCFWAGRHGTKKQATTRDAEWVDLRFLLEDYKPAAPAMLWESVEMLRKLLLCVIGAFWSTKSIMCIATALLISAGFHLLHQTYQPF
eukprot:g1305.t1